MPFANGVRRLPRHAVNARDGGINGVKITFEECETGYATDRGVECYERLKGKGPTGAAYFSPLVDRHHLRADREGAGRQDPADHHGLRPRRHRATARCSSGTSRCSAPTGRRPTSPVQHIAKKEGGFDKLKGKKIALVYHDSPYGKEPIAAAARSARKMHGFELLLLPVTAPGRRAEVDLAADPPAAARLRAAVGLGRDELDRRSRRRSPSAIRATRCTACGGRAPSPTCMPAGEGAKGYNALTLQHAGRPVQGPQGHR